MSTVYAGKLHFCACLFFGALGGFLLIKLLPLAELHPAFLLVLPLVCLFVAGLVIEPASVLVLVLFSRALLDPVFTATKTGNSGLGFGAVLNLSVILMTLILVLKNPVPLFKSAFFKCWLFFLLICLATVAYSSFPWMSIKLFFSLASYFCMAILPWLVHPERNDKKNWIKLLLLSSVLPVVFANVDMVRGGHFYPDAGNRILGTFMHPNILAFYLVWVIALVLYVWKSGLFNLNQFQRTILWAYLANLFLLLLATKTRSAWIGAWLLFFIYGVLKEKKYIVFCVALLIAGLFSAHVVTRFSDLFAPGSHNLNSLMWRMNVLKNSWALTLDRWAFGHGLATFHELSNSFVRIVSGKVDAHNIYLQLMFETGVAGLAAYLLIYWQMLRAFYQRYKYSAGHLSREHAVVLAYTLVYLINGFGDNLLAYLTLNWYCWFFWGVILKAMQYQRIKVGSGSFRSNV